MMDWNIIDSPESIEKLLSKSFLDDVLIFKHSTSCSISHMAKMRLEDQWDFQTIKPYFLDLKRYRILSDLIADRFNVHHESPQILLIRKGQCIYEASHFDISIEELKETLSWHQSQGYAQGI